MGEEMSLDDELKFTFNQQLDNQRLAWFPASKIKTDETVNKLKERAESAYLSGLNTYTGSVGNNPFYIDPMALKIAIEQALLETRNEALEEAIEICRDHDGCCSETCYMCDRRYEVIRSLKTGERK